MPRYSDERRQAVVAKLLPPCNQSVEEVTVTDQPLSITVGVFLVLCFRR